MSLSLSLFLLLFADRLFENNSQPGGNNIMSERREINVNIKCLRCRPESMVNNNNNLCALVCFR